MNRLTEFARGVARHPYATVVCTVGEVVAGAVVVDGVDRAFDASNPDMQVVGALEAASGATFGAAFLTGLVGYFRAGRRQQESSISNAALAEEALERL